MVVYLYRWKIKPEKEKQFINAWTYATEQLRDNCGALGSRLHRGNDGVWYAYAQWPSTEQREKSTLNHKEMQDAREAMKDAATETFPEVILTPEKDFLISE